MRTAFFGLAFALFAGVAAPAAADTISAAEAINHIGDTETVVGVFRYLHRSESHAYFLNLDSRYPNGVFSAVIFAVDVLKFPRLYTLLGKKLAITGKIRMYQHKPEIVVFTKDQLQVVQ